jgi:hypothetical protein
VQGNEQGYEQGYDEIKNWKYKNWGWCKGNLTVIRRKLHLDLAKGNPK